MRPLEWFNLASLHGPYQFLLHDDFYDGGRACAPTIPVEAQQRFPMPSLAEMEGNAERLLDYSATRHFLWEETEPELVAALRRLEPSALLARLQHRFATAKDEHVEHVCLVVCGHAVGALAEQWIEARYAAPTPPRLLGALAYAASRCLAETRGFDLAAGALTPSTTDLAQTAFACLGWFRRGRGSRPGWKAGAPSRSSPSTPWSRSGRGGRPAFKAAPRW